MCNRGFRTDGSSRFVWKCGGPGVIRERGCSAMSATIRLMAGEQASGEKAVERSCVARVVAANPASGMPTATLPAVGLPTTDSSTTTLPATGPTPRPAAAAANVVHTPAEGLREGLSSLAAGAVVLVYVVALAAAELGIGSATAWMAFLTLFTLGVVASIVVRELHGRGQR